MMVPREMKLGSTLSTEAVQRAFMKLGSKSMSAGRAVIGVAAEIVPVRSPSPGRLVGDFVARRELQIAPTVGTPQEDSNVTLLPVPSRPNDVEAEIGFPLGDVA